MTDPNNVTTKALKSTNVCYHTKITAKIILNSI